jgi:hypothetical protein
MKNIVFKSTTINHLLSPQTVSYASCLLKRLFLCLVNLFKLSLNHLFSQLVASTMTLKSSPSFTSQFFCQAMYHQPFISPNNGFLNQLISCPLFYQSVIWRTPRLLTTLLNNHTVSSASYLVNILFRAG